MDIFCKLLYTLTQRLPA